MTPLFLAAVLAVVVLCLILSSPRRRRALPRGTIVYSDADSTAQLLRSPVRPLVGKPDYVIRRRRGDQVPVELKSYRSGMRPPHADVIQLGAYLVLLDDLDRRPPYGVLQYRDRAVRVPYTPALRAEVLRLLEQVRQTSSPPAGTPHAALCRACPFRSLCEQAQG